MEVIEQSEAFSKNPETDDIEFSPTKVILKQGDQYYHATTRDRFPPGCTASSASLDPTLIPLSRIWPQFPPVFTQALTPVSNSFYVKRPSLVGYEDPPAAAETPSLLLNEAAKCEILKIRTHPNIAKYLGCLVRDGYITGLCFLKYNISLPQRLADPRPFDADRCMKGIKEGVQHLHALGLVHCDINPYNIMIDGDTPVIIDYDSCAFKGEKLGIKAGTRGWTDEEFEQAMPENDLYGVEKIREFIRARNH